jgi:hypothetical protein
VDLGLIALIFTVALLEPAPSLLAAEAGAAAHRRL